MTQETLISIIIPAFNEEASIGKVILAIAELELIGSEILVVDDGSNDATAKVAQAAGARVISHPYNIGNGAAVKTGIRASRGRVLVFLDGDGQHDPNDIPRLLAYLPDYHMVVGARQPDSQTSIHRDLANFIYNRFATYVARFPIADLTSGFRAMRRPDAIRFCDMLPNTFSYPTTSTLAFLRSGRAVKYVPITTRFRVGRSKIRLLTDGPGFLLIIMKIATLFAPLRVFLPVSIAALSSGFGWYLYTFLLQGRFTNMSALLINTSVIVFMLGLVAEQIASLRLERGDKIASAEDRKDFEVFSKYSETQSEKPMSEH